MKKHQDKNPIKPTQREFKVFSNSKNQLANRLFDGPSQRTSSQKRPRIFSNQAQKNQLTPTIVKQHQKKVAQQQESLPPIEQNLTRRNYHKMKTEESQELEYIESEKLTNLKKSAIEFEKKGNQIGQIKAKQILNRSKLIESRMNRTLTESRQVIHLMDKMKGNVHLNYLKEEKERELSPETRKQQIYSMKEVQRKKPTYVQNLGEKHKEGGSGFNLQNSKEIDLFIYMAEDGKIPDYEFYYMLKEESNDYYNMDIVTYQSVMKKNVDQYYTLSGHGVTKYEDSRPVEFLSLADWDAERRQFNELKELLFFKKFRKWKTLKKWITILSRQKLKKISEVLEENLFYLNNDYRSILLTHFNICFDIQQFKCIYIPSQPLTVENFREEQEKRKRTLIINLKQCSKQMHSNSVEGLKLVVEDLKNKIIGGDTEFQQKFEKEKPSDQKIEAFVDLGFPSNISFGNRSMVRTQFMRFLRMAYLLDFIAIQSMGKMVVSNIEYFTCSLYGATVKINQQSFFELEQEYFPNSLSLPQDLSFGVTCNSQGRNIFQQMNKPYKPLFNLTITYNELSEIQFDSTKITYSDAVDSFLNFDLERFIFTDDVESTFTYAEDTLLTLRQKKGLSSTIIKSTPEKEYISYNIIEFVIDTLDSMQIVDRWAKNDQFSHYIKALEEWDQIIGDNWSKNQQKFLNVTNWLRQSKKYKHFNNHVKSSIENTYEMVINFIKQHDRLINAFQRNQQANLQRLKDPMAKDQSTVFEIVYNKMIECEKYLTTFLLQKADIYIYSLDFQVFRKEMLTKHSNFLKKLCIIYGQVIKERSHNLKAWLVKSISELSGVIIRIEQFVNLKINLERIQTDINNKKDEIQILGKILSILDVSNYATVLTKEEKQMIAELNTLSSTLYLTINDVENQMPKFLERFKKEIKQNLDKFQKEAEDTKDILADQRFTKNSMKIGESAEELNKLELKINVLEQYSRKHRQYEQVLQLTDFTNFKVFKEIKGNFMNKQRIFNGIIDLENYSKEWNEAKLMQIQVKEISAVCDKYMKDLLTAERSMPENMALPIFKKKLFVFKDAIPVITALRCSYLEPEDFRKMSLLLKTETNFYQNEELNLKEFLAMPFQQCQEDIINIATSATQYFYLKKELDNFENQWQSQEIKLKQFKETSEIIILYDVEELIAKLDQSMATVSNLLSNRYIGLLREKAEKINNQILLAQEIIEKIIQCQKKWVYLENIFAAQDIKKQLMVEAGFFVTADKFLKNLTKRSMTKPLISRLIKNTNLNQLTKILELLEEIQKKLEDYLEVKRKLFSRFYFISNDELVDILANSTNMNVIQKHVNKLFEGVSELLIEKESPTTVDGLISPEGEVIKLINGVSTRFNIEMWLNNLQKQMTETMKRIIRDGNKDYVNAVQKTRVQWVLNHKSQVVMTDNQIIWCNETQQAIKEQAFKRDSLSQWYEMLVKQLNMITELIRTDLKPLYHKMAVALITADVHNRDIIMNLIMNQIETVYDFGWQQQLRYYIEDNDICVVKQVNATMDYGYEYLGATTRLVITPLTDKCWITITSAIANHLGAAPAGPAGTGKTQSTKDLAKGLSRICIVFNCSDQITAQMMSKLFSGLAQQGAWTCLDQFNRIDIEVLSVIAQQLFSIRVGLKKDKGEVQIEGRLLPIKKNFGVFITMNPGYAGRTELPDNLKSLFRPVSMMIPDYAMIAEIMLFAEGFQNASELSRKMIQLYKLASEQLSQQKHYDFGLRAVKSLLVMAGELKRSDSKSSEDIVLIKAMKESNIPKFLINDIYLFEALVSDLFPSVNIEQSTNEKLANRAMECIKERKLGNQINVTKKVIQLHQVINIRFGVMIVGEAGVGKTTCYRILQNAMNKILTENLEAGKKYYKVQQRVINPKSVTMGELYGEIDLLSQEWTDGVLSSIMRECNNCELKQHYWVTLDGPVDSLWIQNLNTVLDDNMTLCLANGERIKLRNQLRMLFEVENLEAASPATVSRCGMVYIPSNTNYQYLIQNSINSLELEVDYQKHLLSMSIQTIVQILQMKDAWFQPIPTSKLQVAQCFMLMVKHFLRKVKLSASYDENIKRISFICAYCLIWSIGSSIQYAHYSQFQLTLRNLVQNVFFPKTETIFDFFINSETFLSFVSWESKLGEFQFVKNAPFHQIMVPTIDTLKYKNVFEIFLEEKKPLLITGQSGVGKTSLVIPFLFAKKENNVSTIFLNFSAKTKPKETQLAIEAKLNKKGKTIFGARPNETIAIFIDDINMPELQKEGAQPTIELLRQYIDYQGFYDRQKLFWKQVVDTTLVSCGATPSGGRNALNSRFTRHWMIVCLPEPSEFNLKKIFGTILKGFLQSSNFNESVKKLADGIVASTLDFYRTIRKELLPIPTKFHYLFNLRDISKIFQGMLQSSVDTSNSAEKFLKLWCHEMSRIFGDRLVDQNDQEWFLTNCSQISKRYTEGLDKEKIQNNGVGINFSYILSAETDEKLYQPIDELKKVLQFLESKIYEYNLEMSGKLELVFFKETIQHILRISRILFQPRGNAMLIGVGGSGKQSLSKISAYISSCGLFQLEMGKNYNPESFRTDLQKISEETGVQQKKLCFLFVDTQILYEEFLESINNMLNTGQVPNLFKKKQEIDDILNRVRPNALKQKKVDSPQSLWSFFISNIRSNLHIILCMSPAGDSLRVRARKFPSLINCCTIDWFNSWTSEALTSVAYRYISSMNIATDQHKKHFVTLCTFANIQNLTLCKQYFQTERRKVQTTPKTFLDQLDLFNSVLIYKLKEIEGSRKILSEGLQKLYSTNNVVTKLKIEMTKLQPKLEEQCKKTDIFLQRLAKDKEAAAIVEKDVLIETEDANQQMIEIKAIKEDAQHELGKAMPMLLEAEEALKKINKADITEIKGYANPHPIVQMVMEAVCTLLNQKVQWANIKIVMMDMNFLDKLRNFEKNNISDAILKRLRVYTTKPDFDPLIVGQKNLASKSLCMWCRAIDNYSKVAKEVEPKKKKLLELEKVFDDKNKVLFLKQRELDKVKEKISKLQKECEETLQLKNKLQSDLDLTGKRLERAEKLTALLKDEGFRWSTLIDGFKTLITEVPGEAYLSSLYLSYLGPFTGEYRTTFISKITEEMKNLHITYSPHFSLTSTLFDQITVRDWVLEGLPNDSVSIENAIITKKGKRYPLMIDPQGQAHKWLKVNQSSNKLAIINFNQNYYLKTLESAVNCGYAVLVEEVQQTLESSIDNLLQKKIQMVEGMKMVTLGDKKISYDERFYLYMTTRLANPKFLAEIFNKSTVINFSITFNGLKDQLLADVCQKQKPEIQHQRDEIIVKVAANRKFLKESQDKILKMLAESKGMVLDDIELINTLEQSKIKSKEVEKSLEQNTIIEEEINIARSSYLPTAIRGTILYFVISKLCLIESMYEFSLEYVKKLYLTGLEKAEFNAMLEIKIKRLNQSITKAMFTSVSRTLFEAHKKLYSFLICCAIKRELKTITNAQWQLFSKGAGIRPKNFKELVMNPDVNKISNNNWFYLHKLISIKGLENLLIDLKGSYEQYFQYFKEIKIFGKAFPGKEVSINNSFHLLLLSKVFSPHNLAFHMSDYVQKQLGKYYDQSHVVSIEEVLFACEYNVPLLFILSSGVDPTANILNYCQTKGLNLESISLGQGQGKKAEALIQRSQIDGNWVLLNNCHLSKSWLGELEKIIGRFSEESIANKNFRLILSSMPVSYFPSNILQNSDKITLEPPRGIKPNIIKSFKELNEDIVNQCPNRRKQWLQCLYSLAFFHALLQERRKYGALGFNVRYDFNDSDLEMSLTTLKIFLNDPREDINWEAIWYMVGQINYGGRVTDDWDRICLMSTLKKCITHELLSLSPGEKYFYSDSEEYYCLNCLTLEDFHLTIDRVLPSIDSPEVFGLHSNANLAFILQESNKLLSCIQLLEPKESGDSSQENGLLDIITNLSVLPPLINKDQIPAHLLGDNDKLLPSMTNFLLQEIQKFNVFLNVITSSLSMLEKAIKGIIPMNGDLDQMTTALSNNMIPLIWRKYCYETMKNLSSFYVDFKQRVAFLEGCFKEQTNAYWISCFFFPQGLLTAFLQTHARKNKIPIDTLSFKFKLTDVEKEKLLQPKEGGYIYGLFFEGARWDSNKDTLADEEPGKLNEAAPSILLLPVENYEINENQYNCPCYKTMKRSGVLSTTGQSTNFILGVHLNSKVEKSEFWTMRGTALICQLNN